MAGNPLEGKSTAAKIAVTPTCNVEDVFFSRGSSAEYIEAIQATSQFPVVCDDVESLKRESTLGITHFEQTKKGTKGDGLRKALGEQLSTTNNTHIRELRLRGRVVVLRKKHLAFTRPQNFLGTVSYLATLCVKLHKGQTNPSHYPPPLFVYAVLQSAACLLFAACCLMSDVCCLLSEV